MTIVDWRQVDARGLALVYARERARWLVELGWETRESWLHVERARTTWGLPGLAAIDDGGRVRGLTLFHATGARFDIGGVFAESTAVREALIDAAVTVCDDAGGEEVAAFLYTPDSGTRELFQARGFAVDRVDYLTLALDGERARPRGGEEGKTKVALRDWQAGDVEVLASLLHASYDSASARRFVPDASAQGWSLYVARLVQHHACGKVLPSATRLAFADGMLVGAVFVTELGPATAHIAQVAVHPAWRRKGLSSALIDEATRLARAMSYTRITLLASTSNAAAQALYRDRGFVESGMFLAATKSLVGGASVCTPESLAS